MRLLIYKNKWATSANKTHTRTSAPVETKNRLVLRWVHLTIGRNVYIIINMSIVWSSKNNKQHSQMDQMGCQRFWFAKWKPFNKMTRDSALNTKTTKFHKNNSKNHVMIAMREKKTRASHSVCTLSTAIMEKLIHYKIFLIYHVRTIWLALKLAAWSGIRVFKWRKVACDAKN